MFETTEGVLCKEPGSLLAALTRTDPPVAIDKSTGCFFFDRDWWLFRCILRFERDGAEALPGDKAVLRELYKEAAFWRLPALKAAIKDRVASSSSGARRGVGSDATAAAARAGATLYSQGVGGALGSSAAYGAGIGGGAPLGGTYGGGYGAMGATMGAVPYGSAYGATVHGTPSYLGPAPGASGGYGGAYGGAYGGGGGGGYGAGGYGASAGPSGMGYSHAHGAHGMVPGLSSGYGGAADPYAGYAGGYGAAAGTAAYY